ncbi:MAG TPA: EI24 domain-containing protein [Microlunatus sp.]
MISEFFAGVRLLGRGFHLVLRRRRLFWFGAVPPLIMSVIFTAVLVVLITRLPALADWLTPFADKWDPGAEQAVEVLAGGAVLGGSLLLMVISFTTLTLALGSPVYDKISEFVDLEFEPQLKLPEDHWLRSIGRSVRQSLTLIAISALVAPFVFAAGFVPVVGQTVVPVISATFGGWMLCLELIGSTFERRGMFRLAERRRAMQHNRARVLGLSIPTFLLMSIPLAGTLVFPIATAAGTLLARDLLGRQTSELPGAAPRIGAAERRRPVHDPTAAGE